MIGVKAIKSFLIVQFVGTFPPHSMMMMNHNLLPRTWLQYFQDTWKLNIRVTHSDKDFSELNALAKVFPNAKSQLCFWHVLRAVKKRLAVLCRQTGYYNVTKATNEFPFIDH